MDHRRVERRSRLSHLLFTSLIAVTVGLLLALVWIDLTWRSTAQAIKARDLRVKDLQGEIVHFDEVLTMSALMAAASGDELWERRYHECAPKLTAAIEEAMQIAPGAGVVAAAQINSANDKLLALESTAFAFMHEGRLEDAQALLLSAEYAAQKCEYAAGMAALDTALQGFVEASDAEAYESGQRHLALNLGVFVFVILVWSLFFRKLVGSENQLVEQHGKLQQLAGELALANHSLEVRAEELAHANADLAESNLHLSTEIETRIHAEATQRELHGKLLAATHRAGMAEIATGVLHNVGNSLNSVNVAATLSMELVKQSRVGDLTRAADLIREHADDLEAFFDRHPRGRYMLPYLMQLAVNLRDDQASLLENLEDLCKKVDHTKQIVKAQQSYARVNDLDMEFELHEIAEDILQTLGGSLEENGIELVREWQEVPPVCSDRHKVMQILANLVTNAIHALLSTSHSTRQLIVRVSHEGESRVSIEVEDTGIGIDLIHLTKIFQYGFTTKQTGHGFGLHHSALVARELGGELRVHSDGAGRGARFTLELPIAREVETRASELILV